MARGDKTNYIVVVQGQRYPFEQVDSGMRCDLQSMAEQVVSYKAGITTPRNNPEPIVVGILRQYIANGQLAERKVADMIVTPPFERMTTTEYEVALAEALKPLPEEFHAFVRSQSWEHGHSSGYEEVMNYATEMISALEGPIKAYQLKLIPASKPRPVHIPMSVRNQADTEVENDR